jgi:hypothetical protein
MTMWMNLTMRNGMPKRIFGEKILESRVTLVKCSCKVLPFVFSQRTKYVAVESDSSSIRLTKYRIFRLLFEVNRTCVESTYKQLNN